MGEAQEIGVSESKKEELTNILDSAIEALSSHETQRGHDLLEQLSREELDVVLDIALHRQEALEDLRDIAVHLYMNKNTNTT